MSNRTDAHRPTALVTENYEYVDSLDLQEPSPTVVGPNANGQYMVIPALSVAQQARRTELLDLIENSTEHRDTGKCDHCGAHLRYVAIMRYTNGQVITVGETCLDNRFGRATADFQAMRKQAELDRKEQRIKKLVAAFVEANPDLFWMASLQTSWVQCGLTTEGASVAGVRANYFLLDVSHKLRQYGELSERQVAAVRAAVIRDAQYAAERAAKVAAAPPATPVVTGRVEITGTVLTTKWTEGQFSTFKMMVRDDRGFRVWGTVPSSIGNPARESRVRFTAQVEASKDDPTFGFYSRPNKAEAL